MGKSRSQRKWARSNFKIYIDEIIGRSLGNVSLEKNWCISEPEGYNLS